MDGGEAEDGGLGFIGLFDDSDTSGGSSERNATDSTGSRNLNGDVDNGNRDRKKSRLEKLQQSEEAFLEQKRSWNPICQKSEASARLRDDFDMSVESLPISTLKSTAEWHYYRRNYEKALNFAQRALSTDADLGENDRKELIPLIKRCKVRLGTHKEHSETVRLPNKT